MDTILNSARLLAQQLNDSAPYKEYLSAKAKLQDQPELLPFLERYKLQMRELADAEDNGTADLLSYKQRVSEAYFSAAAHPAILRFMDAEREAVAIICEVLEIVAGGTEIDLR